RKIATRQQRLLALVLGDASRALLLRIGETEVERAENSGRLARFRLWLDRSDRVRIHEKVLDYELDGVATKPVPPCEICMEKERGVAQEKPGARNRVGNKFAWISRRVNVMNVELGTRPGLNPSR